MAQSLASGISKSGGKDIQFLMSDPSEAACDSFKKVIASDISLTRSTDNQELVSASEIVFLAVKPQHVEKATEDLDFSRTSPLVVSIVAGIRIQQLERLTGTRAIIRVMPNTPCLIGKGATAMAASQHVEQSDAATIKGYLESVGTVVEVEEGLMDSVTGLSGSGPAYVFSFIEALIDGAVLTGMPRDTARQLAVQTVFGAAAMIQETGEHPAVLRDRVTSPGGTTIEGLKALEENSFRDTVMSAVLAATDRAGELG